MSDTVIETADTATDQKSTTTTTDNNGETSTPPPQPSKTTSKGRKKKAPTEKKTSKKVAKTKDTRGGEDVASKENAPSSSENGNNKKDSPKVIASPPVVKQQEVSSSGLSASSNETAANNEEEQQQKQNGDEEKEQVYQEEVEQEDQEDQEDQGGDEEQQQQQQQQDDTSSTTTTNTKEGGGNKEEDEEFMNLEGEEYDYSDTEENYQDALKVDNKLVEEAIKDVVKTVSEKEKEKETLTKEKKDDIKHKVQQAIQDMDESFKKPSILKITGLTEHVIEKDLKEFLSAHGKVMDLKHDGIKRDIAVVMMENQQTSQLVKDKLNGTKLKNCTLNIVDMPIQDTLLFVGNLDFEMTKESLRKMFEKFGEPDRVILMKNRRTGDSKGYGFVDYRTKLQANAARASLGSTQISGRILRVDWAENCSTLESMHSKTIFVDKLPRQYVDVAILNKLFSPFGKVKECSIPSTGQPKGFAFIDYETVEDAEKAQKTMNDKDLQGHKIRVSFGNPSKPGFAMSRTPPNNNSPHVGRGERGGRGGRGGFPGRGGMDHTGRGGFRGGRGGGGGAGGDRGMEHPQRGGGPMRGGGGMDRGGRGGGGNLFGNFPPPPQMQVNQPFPPQPFPNGPRGGGPRGPMNHQSGPPTGPIGRQPGFDSFPPNSPMHPNIPPPPTGIHPQQQMWNKQQQDQLAHAQAQLHMMQQQIKQQQELLQVAKANEQAAQIQAQREKNQREALLKSQLQEKHMLKAQQEHLQKQQSYIQQMSKQLQQQQQQQQVAQQQQHQQQQQAAAAAVQQQPLIGSATYQQYLEQNAQAWASYLASNPGGYPGYSQQDLMSYYANYAAATDPNAHTHNPNANTHGIPQKRNYENPVMNAGNTPHQYHLGSHNTHNTHNTHNAHHHDKRSRH